MEDISKAYLGIFHDPVSCVVDTIACVASSVSIAPYDIRERRLAPRKRPQCERFERTEDFFEPWFAEGVWRIVDLISDLQPFPCQGCYLVSSEVNLPLHRCLSILANPAASTGFSYHMRVLRKIHILTHSGALRSVPMNWFQIRLDDVHLHLSPPRHSQSLFQWRKSHCGPKSSSAIEEQLQTPAISALILEHGDVDMLNLRANPFAGRAYTDVYMRWSKSLRKVVAVKWIRMFLVDDEAKARVIR